MVIYGAGPVGLMAAHSAILQSAALVMVVDRHSDRLKLAEHISAMAIDDSKTSPVDAVLEQTGGMGADRGCECVGYQAHDPQGNEHNSLALNDLVQSVKFTDCIGVVGVYVPQDPGGPDELSKQGQVVLDYGMFWFKGQKMGTGQCPVKMYDRSLRDLISVGKATPSFIVSHELPLTEAPNAYKHFDARDKGSTKDILHPAAACYQTAISNPLNIDWSKRMANDLHGKKIAILATDGVERVELEQPRGALYGAGALIELLSIHPGEIEARQFDVISAGTFQVDQQVSDASVDDYDARPAAESV